MDKDAVCIVVQDADGAGIPNALVTISYLDDAGKRVTQSVVATAGSTPGIAVFTGLPEQCFALVDMQAEGLIRGRSETALVPQGSAKRAETAAILMRFLENGKEG